MASLPIMYAADPNTFATKKMIPTEPPNSGPSALLIITGACSVKELLATWQQINHSQFMHEAAVDHCLMPMHISLMPIPHS